MLKRSLLLLGLSVGQQVVMYVTITFQLSALTAGVGEKNISPLHNRRGNPAGNRSSTCYLPPIAKSRRLQNQILHCDYF